MLSLFQDFIRQEELFQPSDRILLAVSGGMDSVAMTDLFGHSGYSYGIAHCNFMLRAEESDHDEEFVRHLSISHNVLFHVKRFDTLSYAGSRKISIQMAARELRYNWFKEVLKDFDYQYLATAHHQDDQVESFLINLSRGTGIAGLHGILPKKKHIIRPLLFATREMINEYVQGKNLAYKEDSSNREDKYLRNRIRHHVIPQLEKANHEFKENVLQTIINVREAEQIYREAIQLQWKRLARVKKDEVRIDIRGLQQLSPTRTWAFEFLSPYGFNISSVESIIGSMEGEPGKLFFSPTHQCLVDREKLIIQPLGFTETAGQAEKPITLSSPDVSVTAPVWLDLSVIASEDVEFSENPDIAFLDLEKLNFPLEIRKWQQGDYFYPLGLGGRKKISDFFVDLKVSLVDKRKVWMLCSEGHIAWIIGYRPDDRFKVTTATTQVLRIEYKR